MIRPLSLIFSAVWHQISINFAGLVVCCLRHRNLVVLFQFVKMVTLKQLHQLKWTSVHVDKPGLARVPAGPGMVMWTKVKKLRQTLNLMNFCP